MCAIAMLGVVFPWPASAMNNGGLGPLTIRDQFPITLPFLVYTPVAPLTLPDGVFRFSYQMALTNTFINTQSPLASSSPTITSVEVAAGLTAANFPATGYGLYVDVEAMRHVMRFDYGWSPDVELGLELALVSYGGGFLDSKIETVESLVGGLNEDRIYSDMNRFDYYVYKDGVAIHASSAEFSPVLQDPRLYLKWKLSDGGDVLPAFSLRLAYKPALDSNPTGGAALVNSGASDFGYYFMLGKAVGNVVGHFQWGFSRLGLKDQPYQSRIAHHLFGLEFRTSADSSWVLQSVTQSSLFIGDSVLVNLNDFILSRSTDVTMFGYKVNDHNWLWEWGLIEDYNQERNAADITLYFEMGWEW